MSSWRCFTDPQLLLLERTQLVESGQSILGMPGPYNLSVLEFVDVYCLDGHLTVLGRKAHERPSLRSREFRSHDDLISVLKKLRRSYREIGKGLSQIIEYVFDTPPARGLTRGRWNVDPVLAHDLLGERRIPLVESVIPSGDIAHDAAPLLSMNRKAQE